MEHKPLKKNKINGKVFKMKMLDGSPIPTTRDLEIEVDTGPYFNGVDSKIFYVRETVVKYEYASFCHCVYVESISQAKDGSFIIYAKDNYPPIVLTMDNIIPSRK